MNENVRYKMSQPSVPGVNERDWHSQRGGPSGCTVNARCTGKSEKQENATK